MIYNSILDVCPVVFVNNLAIHSLEFDQISVQTWQNFTSSIMADVGMLTLLWFSACLRSCIQMMSEIAGKFKVTFFQCQICVNGHLLMELPLLEKVSDPFLAVKNLDIGKPFAKIYISCSQPYIKVHSFWTLYIWYICVRNQHVAVFIIICSH